MSSLWLFVFICLYIEPVCKYTRYVDKIELESRTRLKERFLFDCFCTY